MPQLLVFTWPYALVFCLVFLWTFAPEFAILRGRPQERSDTSQDAKSKPVILFGQQLATFGAFWVAFAVPGAALPASFSLFCAGVIAIVAGSLLRRHCWRMLGESFTGAVIVKSAQTVVDRGAYRYVRHPSYSGGALVFLGIGLALANCLSILVLLLSSAIVYAYGVRVEEGALATVLGEPYRAYMNRTKRFIPFVF